MSVITAKEARYHFKAVLDRVTEGEVVDITRRGQVVATLSAPRRGKRKKLPNLDTFRKKIEYRGKPLSQIVIDQRREERF